MILFYFLGNIAVFFIQRKSTAAKLILIMYKTHAYLLGSRLTSVSGFFQLVNS